MNVRKRRRNPYAVLHKGVVISTHRTKRAAKFVAEKRRREYGGSWLVSGWKIRRKARRSRSRNGRWTKARKAMWRHQDRFSKGVRGYWKKADRLRKRFSKLHRLRKFKYQAAQRRRVSNRRRR